MLFCRLATSTNDLKLYGSCIASSDSTFLFSCTFSVDKPWTNSLYFICKKATKGMGLIEVLHQLLLFDSGEKFQAE
jgi:hypothetical protein